MGPVFQKYEFPGTLSTVNGFCGNLPVVFSDGKPTIYELDNVPISIVYGSGDIALTMKKTKCFCTSTHSTKKFFKKTRCQKVFFSLRYQNSINVFCMRNSRNSMLFFFHRLMSIFRRWSALCKACSKVANLSALLKAPRTFSRHCQTPKGI